MINTDYTKGEWEFTEELGADFSMIAGERNVVCGLPNPIPSGDENYDKQELEEMRANAHLISAAPDMYELILALRKNMENELRITDKAFGYGIFIRDTEWRRVYEGAIIEVLAKAEGKQSD